MEPESADIHKLKAFNLGNIISSEQSIKGISKLANPPINNGIIIKRIIDIPWEVMHELYWTTELRIKPGRANSNLIILDDPIPIDPPIKPINIYNPPITKWLVEYRI